MVRLAATLVSIGLLTWVFGGYLGIPVALLWVAATGSRCR